MLRAPLSERFTLFEKGCKDLIKQENLKTNEPYSTPTYPSEGHRKRERLGKDRLLGTLCLHPGGNLRARRQLQLLEDVADVVLYGALREHELFRDPAVGEPARHQLGHLPLAAGESG